MSSVTDTANLTPQSLEGAYTSKPLTAPEEKSAEERGQEFPGWNGAEAGETARTHQLQDGSMRVGNIEISALVAKQLRDLGHSIESYTPGQLKEAMDACHYDGTLVEDHGGVDFSDRLYKTKREADEELYDNDVDTLTYRSRGGKVSAPASLPTPNQPTPEQQATEQQAAERQAAEQKAAEQQSWVERTSATPAQEQQTYVARLEEERAAAQLQAAEHSTAA